MVTTDSFGNPIDPSVSYARGCVLGDLASEALRMLNGRRIVRERILAGGNDNVFNLTALSRGFPVDEEDLGRLETQFTYYAHFDGAVERKVVEFLRRDPHFLDLEIKQSHAASPPQPLAHDCLP